MINVVRTNVNGLRTLLDTVTSSSDLNTNTGIQSLVRSCAEMRAGLELLAEQIEGEHNKVSIGNLRLEVIDVLDYYDNVSTQFATGEFSSGGNRASATQIGDIGASVEDLDALHEAGGVDGGVDDRDNMEAMLSGYRPTSPRDIQDTERDAMDGYAVGTHAEGETSDGGGDVGAGVGVVVGGEGGSRSGMEEC
eukprot:GFYU01049824.1.p1 GENE.GFYU01049824.1~~GFYU01049824.1.p1  ORF type:complete len:193 (+),score=57.16 GFYU01049824.1:2-580(+)